MFNRKRIVAILTINAFCLLTIAGLAQGEERYIVDTITVSLREGAGPQYKVIKTLQTGQAFEVLETQGEFVRVRTKEGEEGWLQERFTNARPPDRLTIKDLNEKVSLLTAQNEQLTANLAQLNGQQTANPVDATPGKEAPEQSTTNESAEAKRLQTALDDATRKFKELETASADVLQIMEENDKLKAELSAKQSSIAQLQQANDSLEDQQKIYWFIAGGGVFLLGWIIGKISIRRQRHHSSLTL